jgi:hypothetical protein
VSADSGEWNEEQELALVQVRSKCCCVSNM